MADQYLCDSLFFSEAAFDTAGEVKRFIVEDKDMKDPGAALVHYKIYQQIKEEVAELIRREGVRSVAMAALVAA